MATSSSSTAFVTLEKSMVYRGQREHWANAYHVDSVPSSTATWSALAAAIWALERNCFPPTVMMEIAYGHEPGTPPILVFEDDYAPSGEGGPPGELVISANDHPCPGDAAIWVRYGTTQKTVLGKPIYLRNYYHGIYNSGLGDVMMTAQQTAFNTLGTQLVAGVLANGTTFHRAGPRGAVAQNHKVGDFITTRTLKHRGKRHRFDLNNPQTREWWLTKVPPTIV